MKKTPFCVDCVATEDLTEDHVPPRCLFRPSGLYIGKAPAFNVDLTRIFRVVGRTVRGLFFEQTKRRLDPSYDVMAHSNDTLSEQAPAYLEELTRVILTPLSNRPARVIGNEVFVYRYAITSEDPDASAWALTFYRKLPFLALTGPKVDPRRR
jgi:hypothetical protein